MVHTGHCSKCFVQNLICFVSSRRQKSRFLCYLHVLSTVHHGKRFSLHYIQFYQPGTETGFSWPQPSHHKLGTELQPGSPEVRSSRSGRRRLAPGSRTLPMAGGWHCFKHLCRPDATPSFLSCSNAITIRSCKREALSLNFWSINSLKSVFPL